MKGYGLNAVIVHKNQPIERADGSTLRLDENAAVVLNNNLEPRGTRVFGPIARELRDATNVSGGMKIVSLAPEVL